MCSQYLLHICTGSYKLLQLTSVFIRLDSFVSLSPDDARSVQQLSSVSSGVDHSRGFSNLCQLFAWLVTVRTMCCVYVWPDLQKGGLIHTSSFLIF